MSSENRTTSRSWWFFVSFSRGLAAFFALYSLLSIGASLLGDAYNQNAWWIDFSYLHEPFSGLEQLTLTLALGVFACHVPRHAVLRGVLVAPVIICIITAIKNTVDVFAAAAAGTIILGFPLPFSVFVCAAFACIGISIVFGARFVPSESRQPSTFKTGITVVLTVVCTGLLFPLGQMHCFGTTNYRVPVDAVVVLGAQVYPNGTPSPVLQDRLDTAIAFYEEGYTSVVVLSGGVDVDGTSEAQVMQDYVVAHGVPLDNTIIDEGGSNTRHTAQNTVEMLRSAGLNKVAAVSNFYHLARIKMLYLAEDVDVVTVPSVPVKDPGYPLINVAREIPGWWYYWLLNLVE